MEKKMETTIVHWGYIGIMEKKMETTQNFIAPAQLRTCRDFPVVVNGTANRGML